MLFSFSILLGFILHLLFVKYDFMRAIQSLLSARHCGRGMQGFLLGVLLPSATLYVLGWLYGKHRLLWFLTRAVLSALVFHAGASLRTARQIAEAFLTSPEDALSMLSEVRHSPSTIPENDAIRGAIEWLCSDFVTASAFPILSMLIAGPSFGLFCNAICLLAKPERSGFTRKLSNLLLFWPSRLGAFFMTVACGLLCYDARNGRRIYQQARSRHPDAAAGQILSVCAGSLHIRFPGKDGCPIGNVDRPVVRTDIFRMRDLFLFSSWLMLLGGCFVQILFFS